MKCKTQYILLFLVFNATMVSFFGTKTYFQKHVETYFQNLVESNLTGNFEGKKCLPWTEEADKWWEMHPEWEVESEHKDTLCFSPIKDQNKSAYFKRLHEIQYNVSNCDNMVTKMMWCSGFGADMSNVVDGLAYSFQSGNPFQITMKEGEKWHYAAYKEHLRNGREPVCPSADMFCYFLPIGVCAPRNYTNGFIADDHSLHDNWLTEYATRPQQWLRHRIFNYIAKNATHMLMEKDEDCAVVHIRRTDVVLHGAASRKYFAVEDYLKELKENNFTHIKNILLFTDDATAIDEAHEFHPEYNWMYLKKKRHRGSEGGWENQIPGDSPADEMVAMLSEFRLAQQCDIFVHTSSTFSNSIYRSMVATGRSILRLRPDEKKDIHIFHQNNTESAEELQKKLDLKRRNVSEGLHIMHQNNTVSEEQLQKKLDIEQHNVSVGTE